MKYNTTRNSEKVNGKKSNFQFICEKCGEGFNQKSRIDRHMETSHPKPAPSAADIEKILSGIDYPLTNEEVINYAKQKEMTSLSSDDIKNNNDLLNLIQSLPVRKYRFSGNSQGIR